MKKQLLPTTLRGKIIAYTAAVTLLIAAATVFICFSVFQTFVRRNQIQSAEYNLQVVAHNVSSDLENIIYFTDWCRSNQDMVVYLESFLQQTRMPAISSQNSALRTIALNAHARLKEEYFNTHSADYISRVIVSPQNRHNYLQLSETSATTVYTSAETVYNQDFFQPLFEAWDYDWRMIPDPHSRSARRIIPVVRPIYNQYNSEIIGWTYLAITDRLILDYLSAIPLAPDNTVYLTIGDKHFHYTGGELLPTDYNFTTITGLTGNALSPDTKVEQIRFDNQADRQMVTCPLNLPGWSVSLILSEQDYQVQQQFYVWIILGITVIITLMGLTLTWLLNRTISQPVNRIRSRITCIAGGDFSTDNTIEGTDELGIIGQGINQMAENVNTLMERRVTDEKQKKDLEYQILQNQINPHFLYNTLNSIKWMATIQNAPGIAEMTTSLARLMKNVSKGTAAQIPLKEELDLVKDYVLILQYRYGGSLSVEYDITEETLSECLIHRFTLQPLVENALFHGIEPKGCTGMIRIQAKRLQTAQGSPVLQIAVTDNGIGMDEATIKQVLSGDSAPSSDFFRQLGIHNVNKRIQYEFGPDYGITIDSVVGEYTTMIITLPYQKREDV